jgi:sugar phosphate isomerase/epimerase
MRRRAFLTGTAAGVAAIAGLSRAPWAQGQAPAAGQGRGRQGGRGGRGGGGRGRGGSPANVSADKLTRLAIMTLDFSYILTFPWSTGAPPENALSIFDLPQMYKDVYGVSRVEFQHSHISGGGSNDGDPAFLREMKARLDAAGCQASQINLEFGQQNISNPDAAMRQQAVERTTRWIDNAVLIGSPRVMINQSQSTLNNETRAHAVATWTQMVDYGKTKNVLVAAETRGSGGASEQELGMKPWQFLYGVARDAGAVVTLDMGNAAAADQEEMNQAIRDVIPITSGNMHVKSNVNWDIGEAVRVAEAAGYRGLYSIEVREHPAVRIVYNTILTNLGRSA